jgi:hypothetical protein
MSAPVWYPDWGQEASRLLRGKNAKLEAEFGIGTFPRYDYDVDKCQIVFSRDGRPRVRASIQVVGTTSAKNWLWAWGNDWWPGFATRDASMARAFGEEHGIGELTSAYLEDEDLLALGWDMTSVTARISGAAGAYRPPGENGDLFLLLRDVSFVT